MLYAHVLRVWACFMRTPSSPVRERERERNKEIKREREIKRDKEREIYI